MKSPELTEFFSLLGKAKKEKKEEKLIEQLDSIIDVIENPKEVKDITEPAVTVGVPEDFDVSSLEDADDNPSFEVVETPKKETRKNQLAKTEGNDSEKDYEYSRANLYSLVEKGQEAVNGILELAQESDSARAYEVAATTIKAVADTTDKHIDLQQKMKDLEQDPNKGPTNVTNALFVGSTAELSKLIKNQKDEDNK